SLDRTAAMLQESFSELESNRTQLQTLRDSMQEAVIAISAEKKLLWANGAMRKLASQAEREGTPLIEVIRDPALLDSVESSIQSGEAQSVTTKSLSPGKFFQVTVAPM